LHVIHKHVKTQHKSAKDFFKTHSTFSPRHSLEILGYPASLCSVVQRATFTTTTLIRKRRTPNLTHNNINQLQLIVNQPKYCMLLQNLKAHHHIKKCQQADHVPSEINPAHILTPHFYKNTCYTSGLFPQGFFLQVHIWISHFPINN